ncbi:MAG: protein adenylyltransferase SelO [Bacteroidales bacterium]
MFKLEYSYLSLPSKFYHLETPASISKPEMLLLNDTLVEELNIPLKNQEDIISFLLDNQSDSNLSSFAQAYAGHQFGYFSNLGDGRAIVMGEYVTPLNKRFDIQLKGSGRTLYSRGGDGKATLKAMLREYLMSEAMHFLKIPTSRSLAVAKTGEWVQREIKHEGAVLARLMKSHIRIGTFEYARHYGTTEDLQALTNYTINRLYPEIQLEENPVIGLLKKVMTVQIDLVVNWMRVGFIHGVMNTDNVSISGETFDYGPCAFMNTYHPETVFSSIDSNGRYAFGNQPEIIKWNIARFAEALLPIIHYDIDKSLQLAQSAINEFDEIWEQKYYKTMLNKIGIESNNPKLYSLVDELLNLMKRLKMDYCNTFWELSQEMSSEDSPINRSDFKPWLEKWKNAIDNSCEMQQAKQLMNTQNPVFIPRNQIVEQALDKAVNGNLSLFQKLLGMLSNPYKYKNNLYKFMKPPDIDFERNYQTFCGT